jgi:hypothetical protein
VIAVPQAGFCFLSTTKTGSTAVEQAFQRYASVVARRPPRVKHATAATFDKVWVPVLAHYGHPRESYELVCVVREPVDWVHSWWRYRARPGTEGRDGHTGDVPFDAFAEQVVSGAVRLGSSANFVRVPEGRPPVERVYRYEHLGDAVAWMAGRLGVDVPDLGRVNASPRASSPVTASTRRLLEDHFAADVALHASAR